MNMFWKLVTASEIFNNLASSLKTIGSGLATVVALFGTGAAQGAISLPRIPFANAPFPVRLILFVLLSAGMGWMLGMVTNLVRQIAPHARYPFAALAALLLAGLTAGAADWLFSFRHNSGPIPLHLLMVLFGALIAIRATALNFDATGSAVAVDETRLRSAVMAAFSIGIVLILLLREIGVQ